MDRICIAVLQKGLESTGMDLGVDCPKEVQRRSPKWFLHMEPFTFISHEFPGRNKFSFYKNQI